MSGPYAPLMKAVEQGLKGEAAACTKALLAEKEPLELVDEALIPALDIVGVKYEKSRPLSLYRFKVAVGCFLCVRLSAGADPHAANLAVAVVPPVAGFGPKIKAVFIHKQLERHCTVCGQNADDSKKGC